MTKLKDCPFCGGEAKIETKRLSEVFAYADQVTIKCQDCGCSRFAHGDTSKGGYADNSKCKQQAIEAWNFRNQKKSIESELISDVEETEKYITFSFDDRFRIVLRKSDLDSEIIPISKGGDNAKKAK